MAETETIDEESEEKFRSFRVDITLVLVGLFLALGVQNIIQFVETASAHVSPYFYLAVGVGSLIMVLVCLNQAARIAGLVEIGRRRYQSQKKNDKTKDGSSGASGTQDPRNA